MAVQCPRCGAAAAAGASCPRCGSPLSIPSLTMPIDERVVATLETRRGLGGVLDEDRTYSLVVVEGRAAGAVFPLGKAHVTIGREGCDVVLDDPEISRQHATLAIRGRTAVLEDLGSTNGTFVDDRRVATAELEDRSEFRIGSHRLVFVVAERSDEPC